MRIWSLTAIPLLGFALWAQAQAGSPASKDAAKFTLSGTVVNSVSGEPVPRALVRVSAMAQRIAFSDAQGHFQIEGLSAGRADVGVQKPGYFNQQELPRGTAEDRFVQIGPNTGDIVVKLTPQSAIYGRVTDPAGQPIEQVPVRVTARVVRDGRKRWEPRGYVQTDEDGRFRIANLLPGSYYLEVGPGWEETHLLPSGERPRTGYPSVYYPGVPDLASASPIQLTAGQQAEADLTLNPAQLFRVSGTVSGYPADQGFANVQFLNQLGEPVPVRLSGDAVLGTFAADGVPPGFYILKVSARAGASAIQDEVRLQVTGNLNDVHLALSPAISIPVIVHTDSRATTKGASGWSNGPPPLTLRLVSTELGAVESYSTLTRGNAGNSSLELQNVEPGNYAVDLMPREPWYVQSAAYGPANLLSDNLSVARGQAYPMEIVLRDDSATLTGTVKSSDTSAAATVVAISQPASHLPAKVGQAYPQNGFNLSGLAPGEYLVFAFDHADAVEYMNPEALQPYVSQAVHVTLTPNQKSQIQLTLIHAGGPE